MAYKTKDELLDALYDHVFGEDEPNDDDETWFEHLSKFFDQFDNDNSGGNNDSQHRRRQRRNQEQNRSNPPRRKQRTATGGSGYGSTAFFGTGG